MAVSVIIPHWNRADLLPLCFGSLQRETQFPQEVILVDNGSRDNTLDLLARDYPWVKVISLGRNRGFSYAVNRGIEASRGDFVALLNNDVEVDSRWLAELLAGLERYPAAGMATPKLLLWDDRQMINAAGDFYTKSGLPGNRGVWQKDHRQFDREEFVFGPGGAASLFRRSMLKSISDADGKILDEGFFSYCEDVDLAWRAQLFGYRCLYVPTAIAYHRLSATGGGALASYYNGRNFIYVLAKDYPGSLLRKYWPLIIKAQLGIAGDALRAWRGEVARARLWGQLVGFLTWPRMLKKRRLVQKRREVSDEYLENLLAE